MTPVIIGGVLGLIFTHTIWGAILGGFAGWFLVKRRTQQRRFRQADFVPPLFAFLGALAKSDGRVSEEEINVAERLMARMQLATEQRRAAIDAFAKGKQAEFDIAPVIAALRQWAAGRRDHAITIVDVALDMVIAGGVTTAKFDMLRRLTAALHISEVELMALMAMKGYRWEPGGQAGARHWQQQGRQQYRRPARPHVDGPDPYTVLGVDRDADAKAIKRAYRKLISEHHPDRLGDLPEEMRARAEKRAREINAAYEKLKTARGFS